MSHRMFDCCQAVLFDLDGTLIDSVEVWFHIVNAAAQHFNRPIIERDVWLARSGTSVESNVKLFFGDLTVDQFNQFANEKYCHYLHHLKLIDGSIQLLQHCSGLYGSSSMGLVSNCPHSIAELVLKHFNMDQYFNCVVCADDQVLLNTEARTLKPKPAADVILHACSLLNVEPANAVLIGDSCYDIQAARAGGCPVIGVGVEGGDASVSIIADVIECLHGNHTPPSEHLALN